MTDLDDDAIKDQVLPRAFELWLSSCSDTNSAATRRNYETAFREFFAFTNGAQPWRITGAHALAWQDAMRSQGLADTTVNLRLAGVSSFYTFCLKHFSYPDPRSGGETFLVENNPIDRCKRSKVVPYGKADGLSRDELAALLRKVDRTTVEGMRDLALIATYVSTGARSTEIARLKWGDISERDGVVYYAWMGKGGKSATEELLRFPWEAIKAYLKAANRLDTIQPEDYIFIALSDVAARLANVRPDYDRTKQHISSAMINRIVKKWAARAGLDASRIHTHTMRHTAADLRLELSGGDLMALCEFLHHSSVATTQIYVTRRKKDRDPLWQKVGDFFDGL